MYLNMNPIRFVMIVSLLLASFASAVVAGDQGRGGKSRDSLSALKSAITEAGAPALSTEQETQLKALLTAYQTAQAESAPSQTLKDARAAFLAAVAAGNATEAKNQATIIAGLQSAESTTRMQAQADFGVSVVTILQNGGQLSYLTAALTAEKLGAIVLSLGGHKH